MTKLKKIPFLVTAEAGTKQTVLTLSGTIRKRYWSDDDCIDAKLVRDQLDNVKNDVTIRLNSTGGDVFQGVEIYNYLKNHPSKVTVEVTGTAASAATFICAGADKVIMNTGTTFMIHRGATYAWGNKNDIEATLKMLETIDESIINIYTELTGQTADQIESWMDEEKWFTANETVEYGFATEVKSKTEHSSANEELKAMVEDAVSAAFAASHTIVAQATEPNSLPETKTKKSLLARLSKKESK
ncbi:head maturation protease, ClpP-related [Enterococcus dispar]|uniref:ATP-dependent Clp protease proteolytic subunit n=1 Tax=Enterococcus dispar ATCC 51266 TaxID=1139219 RepID=S1NII3_9ENTE|nr:head maturation protease, ClpP-related [Enterococcus dispar]EOT43805.1 ATP-dependent Clp endopeptidase, proteolytic subunit ClpP [Enterococcus dispar ATCC 51266]EOW85523.1 ATP-dependent Clp endopeptidase, proteolytic subunit ClpP [Enterococcus dispar ATCC 51266]